MQLGTCRLGAAGELFDLPVRRVEPADAELVELLAALPQLDRLVQARFAALEPLDDLLQLALRFFERRLRRSLDARSEAAVCDLDFDLVTARDRVRRANDLVVRAHDRVAALERCAR